MSGRNTALQYVGGYDSNTRVIDPNNGKTVREAYGGTKSQAKAATPSKGLFASFGRFGKAKPSGDIAEEGPAYTYDAGIRPSFYWLDVDLTAEERAAQEALAKSLKSDCQDEAVVIEDFAGVKGALFVGVFDGHGPDGRAAAKYAAAVLPRYLAKDPRIWSEDVKKKYKAFKAACYHANDDLHRPLVCHLNATLSGTTACFAVLHGRMAFVGSTGDSRCIVVRRTPSGGVETEQLSWDAKPEVPDEQRRIQSKGGIVAQLQDPSGQSVGAYRVFRKPGDLLPGLAMSRSLGDSLAHSLGVIAKPAFKVYDLQEEDVFMVFGSDGVFDVMDNQRVGDALHEYVHRRDPALSCSDVLTTQAQEQWKGMGEDIIVDDTTAVVVHLRPLPPATDTHGPVRTFVKAAYTNDAANDILGIYERYPNVDPRVQKTIECPGMDSDAGTKVSSA